MCSYKVSCKFGVHILFSFKVMDQNVNIIVDFLTLLRQSWSKLLGHFSHSASCKQPPRSPDSMLDYKIVIVEVCCLCTSTLIGGRGREFPKV
jgi:hypothetical protein